MTENTFTTLSAQKQAEILKKFMELFRGSTRGHGFGEGRTQFNEDKNKWGYAKGAIGWMAVAPTEKEFRDHLTGLRALGIGPLFDDGTTDRLEVDLDKIGNNGGYDIDPVTEIRKVRATKIPLIFCKTKSGGLRAVLRFTEPIEASIVRRLGQVILAMFGWSGNEIFPKQDKLADKDDCPSWTFLPYGPTFGHFVDQIGLNDSAGDMNLEQFITVSMRDRIDKAMVMQIIGNNPGAKTASNGSSSHKTQAGKWMELDSVAETIAETFKGGPPCQWYISHERSRDYQHNFLFNVAIFLKKKYSENWEEALKWVNFNVLSPPGDPDKITALIKDFKGRDYEYRCKDEPICSHCYSHACRRMPYGVGNGKGKMNVELGLTVIDTVPARYFVNIGTERAQISSEDLMSVQKYRIMCVSYRADFPSVMKRDDWDLIVRDALDNATVVDPAKIIRTNVYEMEILERFLSYRVPNNVRKHGEKYLNGDGEKDDGVRVRINRNRFYLKWDLLSWYCVNQYRMNKKQLDDFRIFLVKVGVEHGRTDDRGWFRSTISIGFELFEEDFVNKILHPDSGVEEEGGEEE